MFGETENLTGSVSVTATFEAINPGPATVYGIWIGKRNLRDNANVAIYRAENENQNEGTMIALSDETVYDPSDEYPALVEAEIADFNPGDVVTLKLIKNEDSEVIGYYSVNASNFIQVGNVSAKTGDPFTIGVYGENWPPTELGTGKYEFRLHHFEVSRPAISDLVLGEAVANSK